MGSKMLIDASQREETRVVVARGSRIEEFDFESASRKPLKGNIYLAKVTRVEPSLQAAFVEYGGNRHGFLAFAEIHPDYYQIPIADRLALIKEQEEEEAAAAEEDDDEDNGGLGHSDEDNGGHDHSDEAAAAGAAEASAEIPEGPADDGPGANEDEDAAETFASRNLPLEAEESPAIASAPEPGEAAQGEPAPDNNGTAPASGELVAIEEDMEAQKVDSVGAEDALEEVPRRRERRQPRRRSYKIQEVIKRRQILLVQVVKEERGNKGAALTTYLSLAGRYCVLMPNTARGGGISRKITDAGDRRRLKEVARDVEVPQGMGLIVRTAGAQRTRPEIKRDFDYLLRLWESVRDLTLQSQAPCLVYEEGNLIKRSIRDLYTKDVDEVIVEGEEAYREAKDFMKMLMPSHAKNVKPYTDNKPLFTRYQVEAHLDALFSPTVTLPSGGYLVINQTEALVSIDINSGKATREHSIEDTALKTNLEASDEIARQLRLRDLAGLIVIDFIDMEENRNNRSVERRLKEALKHDRARIQVGRISHFGLLEMSRQRLRPGLIEGTFRTCPHCEGRGMVRSIASCSLGVIRAIEDWLLKRAENLTVTCARDVAFYLLNEKRDSLLMLEQTYGVTIFVVPAHGEMKGVQHVIERATERQAAPRRLVAATPVRIDSAFEENAAEEMPAGENAPQAGADGEEAGEASDDSESRDSEIRDGGRRRRRRGRRGGRRYERDDRMAGQEAGEPDLAPPADEQPREATQSPPWAEDEGSGGKPFTAEGEPAAGAEAREADDARPGEGSDRRRNRRDRFGRSRGRRGDRNGRPDREGHNGNGEQHERSARPENDDGREGRREYRGPQLNATPREPQPQIIIPDVIPDPEPRKWQPPAPTVQAEPTEKKGGWWSRRK
jgi:ribonuclease E